MLENIVDFCIDLNGVYPQSVRQGLYGKNNVERLKRLDLTLAKLNEKRK